MLRTMEFTWEKHHVRELLWQAQDGCCLGCGRPMLPRYRFARSGDADTIDHVWPKGAGGPDKLGNLALMHHKCNVKKKNHLPPPDQIARLRALNYRLGWPTPWLAGND